MTQMPGWLTTILADAQSSRDACDRLLFHGTLEPFEGRLKASSWEGLRWASEDPCVAQAYCPETGSLTGWSAPMSYDLDGRLLPNGTVNSIIFRELGFDEFDLDLKRDRLGHTTSYRVLPNHPTPRQAVQYLRDLGYDVDSGSCWIKTHARGNGEEILPASYKAAGRLFILERPADLKIYNYASKTDGGLTGRQWNHTDIFHSVAASGEWDAILIDDIHHSPKLGDFSHSSFGLFEPTLARLRYHVIDITNFDPWDCWGRRDDSTTPEFDTLWQSCQTMEALAA